MCQNRGVSLDFHHGRLRLESARRAAPQSTCQEPEVLLGCRGADAIGSGCRSAGRDDIYGRSGMTGSLSVDKRRLAIGLASTVIRFLASFGVGGGVGGRGPGRARGWEGQGCQGCQGCQGGAGAHTHTHLSLSLSLFLAARPDREWAVGDVVGRLRTSACRVVLALPTKDR